MGNYCSSSQKKDKDNVSEKSEESPAYYLAKSHENKEPPLAQPEAEISDINGFVKANDLCGGRLNSTNQSGDSISPICVSPPVDISTLLNLPQNLTSLYGRPSVSRRIEKDRKIVLYVLSANDNYQIEKSILQKLKQSLESSYQCKGFEILIADLHVPESYSKSNTYDLENWLDGPLEAQCGHHLAANCLAEIRRHSADSYVIPILFLNSTLGNPLLPLTIENQDFANAISAADNCGKLLFEKWYVHDEKSQPSCYRLKSIKVEKESSASIDEELNSLMLNLVEVFSKELRDSYLTTIVEQEINNTVLMSQELAKRCIWIQNTGLQYKNHESQSLLDTEMNRRLCNIQNDLKNQLAEKHIIKMPVISSQQQDQFSSILEAALSSELDGIVEEHTSKFQIPYCTFGVDRRLLTELEEVNRHTQILNQNCANFSITDRVKNYLTGTSNSPLIIFGKSGSGKSVLSAKIAQNIHTWLPECSFILRYANLTAASNDLVSVLSSIIEQMSALLKDSSSEAIHTQESYAKLLNHLIHKSKHQIVILIDSIDKFHDIKDIDWLPIELVNNVKIILTITSATNEPEDVDVSSCSLLTALKAKVNAQNILFLTSFTQEQWEDVLSNGALQLPEAWKKSDEKVPIQAKILWWLAWLGQRKLENLTISHISEKVFEILESKFGVTKVKYLITLIIASRDGLLETEIIEILQNSKLVDGSVTKLWTNFSWMMGPLLLYNKNIKIMDSILQAVAEKRYESDMECAYKILHDHFEKQPDIFYDSTKKEKCYNTRKFTELPFHSFKIDKNEFETSQYLTSLEWLHDKIDCTSCVQILHDIHLINPPKQSSEMSPNVHPKLAEHLEFLMQFLQIHFKSLNYDAQQLHSLLSTFIKFESAKRNGKNEIGSNSIIQKWKMEIEDGNLLRIERLLVDNAEEEKCEDDGNKNGHDFLINTNQDERFVISLSTDCEEICVWDIKTCEKVRTLIGVPQPSSVCPVGDFDLAVLCKREIRVIDLNQGKFKVTLKGVMNHKMPYFGLHDSQHLVCLSRNRMYVNMMNIESGDCVTTFKAGEDRFLNSLLVSGDGRILVCGDETQKPFPLLVWHLVQRRLMYDLRIPHHDFLTSLSAITYEGSYVAVVAKELNDPAPNFIVVYDLQSGTLFKKWKPSCNTVALAISQANTCVIAGLEDARILIWDLVTGNCRCSLIGHNAPVTLLKLDPLGKVLLSGDIEGRDKSVRVWDLNSGSSLSVYTPSKQITACELTSNGKYITLALKNTKKLVTLQLSGGDFAAIETNDNDAIYGEKENEGKTFNLND